MGDDTPIRYTPALLAEYSMAALQNAKELLAEATLLVQHGHFARAYFLAVASIEETGKAFLAFDSQGRNLSDPAVNAKLTFVFQDHKYKIGSAFHAWLLASPNTREGLMAAVDLTVQLQLGREPSMYSDIRPETLQIKQPSTLTREVAARDCIRVAEQCFGHTEIHLAEKVPQSPTTAQDQLFATPTRMSSKLFNSEDFWWFYIAEGEAGRGDWAEAVRRYQSIYSSKRRLFKSDDAQPSSDTPSTVQDES